MADEGAVELENLLTERLALPLGNKHGREVGLPLEREEEREPRPHLHVVRHIEAADAVGRPTQTDHVLLAQAQNVVGGVVGEGVAQLAEPVGRQPLLHVPARAVARQPRVLAADAAARTGGGRVRGRGQARQREGRGGQAYAAAAAAAAAC